MFLKNLQTYDKDNIPSHVIKKVKKICKRDDFTPAVIKRSSVVACGLCQWVHAIMLYVSSLEKRKAMERRAMTKCKRASLTSDENRQKRKVIKTLMEQSPGITRPVIISLKKKQKNSKTASLCFVFASLCFVFAVQLSVFCVLCCVTLWILLLLRNSITC